ncbi:hypothetical protein A4A49_08259 [Nicotiana attenuata]|uniref:DUF4283 domain-containing protein n=1 Tax=Nicotiana attenuata TaxID=49451 RepID=A0A314KSK0_NICAT|nr:hypothetical protein A4A49_08259 [Nicotiana attenuata]
MATVIFKAKDYYGIMAEECKLTIVGRFLKPRPQIERIRSSFRELFSIKGDAKIRVYDNYNVFIDFTNEDDFKSVCNVGTLLALNAATYGRTRPSMAKVRVEIDLTKPIPSSVWVGSKDEKSQYDGKVGHNMMNCRVLEKIRTVEFNEGETTAENMIPLQTEEGSSKNQEENSVGNGGQKKGMAKQNATKVDKGVAKQNANINVKKREEPTNKEVAESSKKKNTEEKKAASSMVNGSTNGKVEANKKQGHGNQQRAEIAQANTNNVTIFSARPIVTERLSKRKEKNKKVKKMPKKKKAK